eukprot:946082-Rhodomonas_salina.3
MAGTPRETERRMHGERKGNGKKKEWSEKGREFIHTGERKEGNACTLSAREPRVELTWARCRSRSFLTIRACSALCSLHSIPVTVHADDHH